MYSIIIKMSQLNKNSIVNEENINKCLEYIEGEESQQIFKELVKGLKVEVKLVDYGKMEWDDVFDRDNRNIYTITFKRNGKQASIKYGQSLHDTWEGIEPTLYDVLTIVGSEQSIYYNSNSFEDFCDELGYDTDSRKALKRYQRFIQQGKKLAQIFEESEIWSLPS